MVIATKKSIKTFRDLDIYNLSYKLAMEIFEITRKFPKDEGYSLTGQILRSSRSIPANIVEGFSKRKYENVFKKHLNDALGSCDETKVWLDFAKDCKYISIETHKNTIDEYERLGGMIYSLMINWRTFDSGGKGDRKRS